MTSTLRHNALHRFMAALCAAVFGAASQAGEIPPPPITWGSIPHDQLAMTSFPGDTSASAVILCDFCDMRVNDDLGITVTRHLRVKILNERGFLWGTHTIDTGVNGEFVSTIAGATYVLMKDGTIADSSLEKGGIVKEELSEGRNRYTFTLPGLQPGCIVEIRYTIESPSLTGTRPWTFHNDEPVLWSEVRMLSPKAFAFGGTMHGRLPFTVNDKTPVAAMLRGAASLYFGRDIVECTLTRWAMENLGAFRAEPFVTSLEDHYSKVDIRLAGYALPTGGVKLVPSTWEEVVTMLLESDGIGGRLEATSDVRRLAARLTEDCGSPLEKMKAVYDWVSTSVAWNGNDGVYAEQTTDEVLESLSGNSADINYLLVSLLRSAGVAADVIVTRSRANGAVQTVLPSADQFDIGMAHVTIDSTEFFLDATNPSRPFTIVPANVLGARALVLNDDPAAAWVEIRSDARSSRTLVTNAALAPDRSLTGTITGLFKEYAGVYIRSDLNDMAPIDVAWEDVMLGNDALSIDSVTIVDRDSTAKPLQVRVSVSSGNYARTGVAEIAVNPHIVCGRSVNPFTSPTRMFPIDYTYPREVTSYVNLTVPDSFEVKEPLRNKRFDLDGKATYVRLFSVEENVIHTVSTFRILARQFPVSDYPSLWRLYDEMIHAEAEEVVLYKKRPHDLAIPAVPAEPGWDH